MMKYSDCIRISFKKDLQQIINELLENIMEQTINERNNGLITVSVSMGSKIVS